MSFGFSIGDFIAAGNLVIKTYALLQDGTGSSADYQSLKLLRKSFGETVATVETELQSANPNPLPKSLVNAAKMHLSECSRLLQNFDEIAKKYDVCLSPGGSGRKAKDTWRKLKWGSVKDDTRELFRRLQEHIEAVERLFNFNDSQTLRRTDKRTEEICVALQSMQLAKVPKTLDWSDNKPIRFIDGFDRKITLPYEWCTTWQAFHGLLRRGFEGEPESAWVESSSFEILDEDNEAALITRESWKDTISPGKLLSMAMLLRTQGMQSPTEQECPNCQTVYRGYEKCKDLERVRCIACGTWFQVSSEPRITQLSEDDSVPVVGDAKSTRFRRWRVLPEQPENRSGLCFTEQLAKMRRQMIVSRDVKRSELEKQLRLLFAPGTYSRPQAVNGIFELEVPRLLTEEQIKHIQKMSFPSAPFVM